MSVTTGNQNFVIDDGGVVVLVNQNLTENKKKKKERILQSLSPASSNSEAPISNLYRKISID